jgi:hypothetical protein
MSFLVEMRRRKVLQIAGVYLVVAWLIIQVVDVINEPLSLPDWFDTVVIVGLGLGFPIALILAWAFDISPEGATRAASDSSSAIRGGRKLEASFLGLILVGIGWLVVRDTLSMNDSSGPSNEIPVVVLMDTPSPRGVYDEVTRRKSGTNADVLNEVLRDLPIVILKESIGSTWDREGQVLKQYPELIVIHRSAFFHSMNAELKFGYMDEPELYDETKWRQLYEYADNKLMAFLGFIGQGSPHTRFLVYSRGTGGGWADSEYRSSWVAKSEGRFPSLTGRITTLAVPGGVESGSFREPEAQQIVRRLVQSLLGSAHDG